MSTNQQFNWRAHLKVHPAADLFPLLSEAELKTLAEDIETNGVRTQVVLYEDKNGDVFLLDGRNRLDALALLDLLCEDQNYGLATKKCWDRERGWFDVGPVQIRWRYEKIIDPYALALSLNVHRRHLTSDQKRELIAKLLKVEPEQSNNAIAKQVKADDKTVGKVRRDLESTSEIPKLEKTFGADGKARKATRPKSTVDPKDVALESFNGHVLELVRLTKGQKAQRFAKTAVAQPLLGDLAHFLRELVAVRKLANEASS